MDNLNQRKDSYCMLLRKSISKKYDHLLVPEDALPVVMLTGYKHQETQYAQNIIQFQMIPVTGTPGFFCRIADVII